MDPGNGQEPGEWQPDRETLSAYVTRHDRVTMVKSGILSSPFYPIAFVWVCSGLAAGCVYPRGRWQQVSRLSLSCASLAECPGNAVRSVICSTSLRWLTTCVLNRRIELRKFCPEINDFPRTRAPCAAKSSHDASLCGSIVAG